MEVIDRRRLLFACYYGYFVVGLLLTLIGPVVPAALADLGVGNRHIGMWFVVQGVGFGVAVLLGGVLSDAWGRRPVLLAGIAVFSAAALAFLTQPEWAAATALFGVVGIGFGLVETCLNGIVIDASRGSESRALNLLHLFPSLGAVGGPYLAGVLVPFGWEAPLAAIGLLTLLFGAWILPLRALREGAPRATHADSQSPGENPSGIRPPDFVSLIRSPFLLLTCGVMVLYVGAEAGISNWTASYTLQVAGAGAWFGANVTALFWAGLGLGRIAASAISTRLGDVSLRHLRWVRISGGAAMLAYAWSLVWLHPVSVALSTAATGFFLGGVFPTLLAFASVTYPHHVGAVTGVLIAACSVGGAGVPALVGLIADAAGLHTGLILLAASLGLMAAVTYAAERAAARLRTRA